MQEYFGVDFPFGEGACALAASRQTAVPSVAFLGHPPPGRRPVRSFIDVDGVRVSPWTVPAVQMLSELAMEVVKGRQLGPPVLPFFWGRFEASPTKIDCRRTGTLILTSLLDLANTSATETLTSGLLGCPICLRLRLTGFDVPKAAY